MSSWARVGVRCVCVDISGCGGYGHEIKPEVGVIYTIREILWSETHRHHQFLLNEIIQPKIHYQDGWLEPAFGAHRFRPLITQEDDVAMFREWLVVNKVEEEV